MAQNWHKLGFIVKRPSPGPDPIFIEVQRQDPHADDMTEPEEKPVHKRLKMVFPKPSGTVEPITSLESLREHLQAAIAVELSTIPLYLFSMYSVKTPKQFVNDPRYYDLIVAAIRGASVLYSCFFFAS